MEYLFFGGVVTTATAILAPQVVATSHGNRVSLWRGTIMCLCVLGMGFYSLWLYWIAEPFKSSGCGTWVFPFGGVDSGALRHGPILIYAILSAVVGVAWLLAGLTALILFGPDLVTLAGFLWQRRRASTGAGAHGQPSSRPLSWYGRSISNLAANMRNVSTNWKSRALSEQTRK